MHSIQNIALIVSGLLLSIQTALTCLSTWRRSQRPRRWRTWMLQYSKTLARICRRRWGRGIPFSEQSSSTCRFHQLRPACHVTYVTSERFPSLLITTISSFEKKIENILFFLSIYKNILAWIRFAKIYLVRRPAKRERDGSAAWARRGGSWHGHAERGRGSNPVPHGGRAEARRSRGTGMRERGG